MSNNALAKDAINLLQSLIQTQSFSGEEDKTAELIEQWFSEREIKFHRHKNNIWAINEHFNPSKPSLLLNSHHDTVKPNKGYTRDPFEAKIEDGKLYGLGSNDAGGALVSLLSAFTYFYHKQNLNYNIVMAATAEEETNGPNGLKDLLPIIPKPDVAIVGEPTLMNLAIAEKGLVVFDAKLKGVPGHAAHTNDDNVIYKSIETLDWFQNFEFEKTSDFLGPVKLTVTQIRAGEQHNQIPAELSMVIDVRVNDKYSNEEIYQILKEKAPCSELVPRSLNLSSSSISIDHELVQSGLKLGMKTYGSPTLSDQAVLSCESLKLGPGDSLRSHSANEFIYVREIEEAIGLYVALIENII